MWRRFLDSPWPYFVGAGLLLAAVVASQFQFQIRSRSRGSVEDVAALRDRAGLNVVFVLIDTLRADRLGIYGYERPTSPVIDGLARQGVVFKRVLAQSSWTKTSMASLWTATHPIKNGILRFNHVLPEEALLPAEIFKEAGYRTFGIWRNGWVAPNFGFGQGFDVYMRPTPGRERLRMQRQTIGKPLLKGTDEDVVNAAVELLATPREAPVFIYVHLMDIHQYTYDEGSPHFGTSYSDAYDQSIAWTDRVVGSLVKAVDDAGLLTNTLIAISSDHGEAFREHATEGHARNLYGEVTEVPFILVFPFVLEPGIAVETQVSNIDVWPTILDLVGLPPLPHADGVSLVPLILAAGDGGDAPAGDGFSRPLFAHLDRRWGRPEEPSDPLVAVLAEQRRLILRVNQPEQSEFYDRSVDPAESHNLFSERLEEAQRFRELGERYMADAKAPWGRQPAEVELDELQLNQLRALGYVIR